MSFTRLKIFLSILGFLLLSFKPAIAIEDKLAAIVNDDIITEGDIKEFQDIMYLQLSGQYQGEQLKQEMEKVKEEALQRLIEDKLIIQAAKKQNIQVDADMIRDRIQTLKQGFASDEEFNFYLKMHGLTPADIERKFTEQFMMRDIVEEKVKSKIFVNPQEVTDYYLAHADEFQDSEKVDLDSIFIKIGSSEQEAKDKVEAALKSLSEGKDFAIVRERFSEAVPLGIVKKGDLNEEIENIVFKLNVAEVSKPVGTNNGFYIFKLKAKIPVSKMKLEDVRDKIYQFLYERRFEEKFTEWLSGLKESAYILIK